MRRGVLLLVVALVVIVLIVVVVFVSLSSGPGNATPTPLPTAIPVKNVLVALQDIPRGQVVTNDLLGEKEVTVAEAKDGEYLDVSVKNQIVGRTARTDIKADQEIVKEDVIDTSGYLRGSEASLFIPPGMVAVAVPADRLTTIAYAIQPGDHVDIITTFRIVSVDPEFQTILPNYALVVSPDGTFTGGSVPVGVAGEVPGNTGGGDVNIVPNPLDGSQRPRQVTQLTLENLLVLRYGEWEKTIQPTPTPGVIITSTTPNARAAAAQGPALSPTPVPRPDIVTLAMPRQDALVLMYLLHSGAVMEFALRPAGDVETGIVLQPVTLAYTFQRFQIEEPQKLPFTTDPPLWSKEVIGGVVFPTPFPHPNPTPVPKN